MGDVSMVHDAVGSGNQQLPDKIIIPEEPRVKHIYESYLSPSKKHLMHYLSYAHQNYTTISAPTINNNQHRLKLQTMRKESTDIKCSLLFFAFSNTKV
jgi:hypothetical protein